MRRRAAFVLSAVFIVVALGLAACGGRRAAGWAVDRALGWRFEGVPTITTAALAARLAGADPPLLVDARTAEEYAVSHLPGARRVAPDADPGVALADVPRDRPVAVYCSVGWRSAVFAERMAAAGFVAVVNVEGSIFRWVLEDRPLVDGTGAPTARVHAFGAPWSWLVPADRRAVTAPGSSDP